MSKRLCVTSWMLLVEVNMVELKVETMKSGEDVAAQWNSEVEHSLSPLCIEVVANQDRNHRIPTQLHIDCHSSCFAILELVVRCAAHADCHLRDCSLCEAFQLRISMHLFGCSGKDEHLLFLSHAKAVHGKQDPAQTLSDCFKTTAFCAHCVSLGSFLRVGVLK
eukprot:2389337-Amphidinium_carterae.1